MAINKVEYGGNTLIDITDTTAEASDVALGEVFYGNDGVRRVGTGDYMSKVANPTANDILITDANGQAIDSGIPITDKANVSDLPGQATDTTLGLVKINPVESVTLNEDGQLQVGGRLGQYPSGGVFYPVNIEPSGVGGSSFLMTDGAKGVGVVGRTFAIMAGANITCRSAAAGATQYRVSNTQGNRFACFAIRNGRLALDQNDAAINGTAAIQSIKFANGDDISAYFGATESTNDIIITVDRTVNPNAATTKIRGYGTNASTSSDNIMVGQGVGSSGGKAISLGQSTYTAGNQAVAVGNSVHVMANNSAGFGHTLLINKQYCFSAGQGHDFTEGGNGVTAFGTWSKIESTTKFAIGNGTAYNARSNVFEVLADGRVKAKGTPIDNDDLATKAYVDSQSGGGGGISVSTYGNADFTYQKVTDPDTGTVTNECVAYSTVAGNANEPKAIKYGRVVNLCGAFKNINVRASNAAFVMGKVPKGCEPLSAQNIMMQGSSQYKFLLTIATDGTLTCSRYSTGASAVAVPGNAWLNINATYISAS